MNSLLKTLFRLQNKLLNKTAAFIFFRLQKRFLNKTVAFIWVAYMWIPLEKNINICTESIYDQNDSVESLNKSEFKELLSLATKEPYFFFNKI